MLNLHNRLDKYESICDEALIQKQLKKLISETQEKIDKISVKELYKNAQKYILIDVREPEEFASGYIKAKKVLTIPRGKIEFVALDKIGKVYGQNSKIVTYCLKGPRGALAALQLKKLGFKNVKNLEGGILNWLESGYSINSYLGELKLVK